MARKNPGTGWGIDILWPDGETEVIKSFITEHDAAKWIAEHSKARQGNTNDESPPNALGNPNQTGLSGWLRHSLASSW
jgi:hypothetical protein